MSVFTREECEAHRAEILRSIEQHNENQTILKMDNPNQVEAYRILKSKEKIDQWVKLALKLGTIITAVASAIATVLRVFL